MAEILRRVARDVLTMLHERRLEPWPEHRLSASALVVAPHQDDETLGCGGTIARKRDAGAHVSLVFATDGSTSHRHLMPPEQMAALRRDEAVAAAAELGVGADDVHFLDLPNGELAGRTAEAAEGIAALIRDLRPAEVFAPWRDEPPADHRAAFDAAVQALALAGGDAVLHEYPVWLWQQWPWCRPEHYQPSSRGDWWRAQYAAARALMSFRTAVDVRAVRDRKEAALAAHRTQTERRDGDPDWAVLDDVAGGEFRRRCFGDREVFRTTGWEGEAS